MGLYDYYGWDDLIQLKAGPCQMCTYRIGDKVPLADGVYVGYEGLVVIYHGKLVQTFSAGYLFNKWGGTLEESKVLDPDNPIVKAIAEVRDGHV